MIAAVAVALAPKVMPAGAEAEETPVKRVGYRTRNNPGGEPWKPGPPVSVGPIPAEVDSDGVVTFGDQGYISVDPLKMRGHFVTLRPVDWPSGEWGWQRLGGTEWEDGDIVTITYEGEEVSNTVATWSQIPLGVDRGTRR